MSDDSTPPIQTQAHRYRVNFVDFKASGWARQLLTPLESTGEIISHQFAPSMGHSNLLIPTSNSTISLWTCRLLESSTNGSSPCFAPRSLAQSKNRRVYIELDDFFGCLISDQQAYFGEFVSYFIPRSLSPRQKSATSYWTQRILLADWSQFNKLISVDLIRQFL